MSLNKRSASAFAFVFLAGLIVGQALHSAPAVAQALGNARVFELRKYTAPEGKLGDLEKRFRDHTIRIFNRHNMTSIGYWVPQDAPDSQSTLIYILAHPSRDAAKKNWGEFINDPEWKKVSAESEANGKIVQHVDSVYMESTDFSKLK